MVSRVDFIVFVLFLEAVGVRVYCCAGVVTKTTDRDSLRYTYNGTPRVRLLGLGCESN